MRETSSTSNIKWLWVAAFTFVSIELVLTLVAPKPYDVWNGRGIKESIETMPAGVEIAVFGDCMLQNMQPPADPGKWLIIGTSRAVETAGNYFVMKRFFERSPTTKKIVYLALDPFELNLNHPGTENYVKRVFTRWSEIWDLFTVTRDPAFLFDGLLYKLSWSYQERWALQQNVLSAMGVDAEPDLFVELKPSRPSKEPSEVYFEKMARLAAQMGATLYFLPSPQLAVERRFHSLERTRERLKRFESEFPNFHRLEAKFLYGPEFFIADRIHLNEKGRERFKKDFPAALEEIKVMK